MAESPSGASRRTVYFSGTVQGVGFRYTTQIVASRFSVTGFVKNLSDGRVQVVAEGETEELDRFGRAIHETMPEFISNTTVSDSPATGEFTSFSIAF